MKFYNDMCYIKLTITLLLCFVLLWTLLLFFSATAAFLRVMQEIINHLLNIRLYWILFIKSFVKDGYKKSYPFVCLIIFPFVVWLIIFLSFFFIFCILTSFTQPFFVRGKDKFFVCFLISIKPSFKTSFCPLYCLWI